MLALANEKHFFFVCYFFEQPGVNLQTSYLNGHHLMISLDDPNLVHCSAAVHLDRDVSLGDRPQILYLVKTTRETAHVAATRTCRSSPLLLARVPFGARTDVSERENHV
jgi:hypothetical protein